MGVVDPSFVETHYWLRNVTVAEAASMAQQAGITDSDFEVRFLSMGDGRWRVSWETPEGERLRWEGVPSGG